MGKCVHMCVCGCVHETEKNTLGHLLCTKNGTHLSPNESRKQDMASH